jgi:hypothetical protein
MITAERVKELRNLFSPSAIAQVTKVGRGTCADLLAILDDYERLRAEVREWKRIALKTRPPLR